MGYEIIPSDCVHERKDKVISLVDKGNPKCKMFFENPNGRIVKEVRIDGCVISSAEELKCDFMLIVPDATISEHFIELKGSDVDHALKQLRATIHKVSKDFKTLPKCCWVVSFRNPLDASSMKIKQAKFKEEFSSDLKTVKHQYYAMIK